MMTRHNSRDTGKSLLELIMIIPSIMLLWVISENIFNYSKIDLYWKIALTALILSISAFHFLLVFLHIKFRRQESVVEKKEKLRKAYIRFLKLQSMTKQLGSSDDIKAPDYDVHFKHMFYDRSEFLKSIGKDLYDVYERAYQIYLSKEEEYDNTYRKKIRHRLLKFELDDLLYDVIKQKAKMSCADFSSYLFPISLFMFIYFAGFLVTLPLINSIFTGETQTIVIPLFEKKSSIPLLVIQWGFLGGMVYTSISLLTRFLRKDMTPRVYLNASFRLVLSTMTAMVIYFIYMMTYSVNVIELLPQILVICFIAGTAPVHSLINLADTYIQKIFPKWKRMNVIGNKPLTKLEGVDLLVSERLNEEGIDTIQQMAMSNVDEIHSTTIFSKKKLEYWREQAILYLLTGDVQVRTATTPEKIFLYDILTKKAGISTFSSLVHIWQEIKNDNNKQKSLFLNLGLLDSTDENSEYLCYVFEGIINRGYRM
jgi:hypothetical protein